MKKSTYDKKRLKTPYDYFGTGFKIKIINPQYLKIFNEWMLDIDFQKLDNRAYELLATIKRPLTGNEVRFIRLHSGLNMTQFGERLSVSHAAVGKWEKTKDTATKMEWNTEREIRMFILNEIETKPAKFIEFWRELETKPGKTKTPPMKVDAKELIA